MRLLKRLDREVVKAALQLNLFLLLFSKVSEFRFTNQTAYLVQISAFSEIEKLKNFITTELQNYGSFPRGRVQLKALSMRAFSRPYQVAGESRLPTARIRRCLSSGVYVATQMELGWTNR